MQCAQQHASELQDTQTARDKIPDNVLRLLESGQTTEVLLSLDDGSPSLGDDVTGATGGALLSDMELMPAVVAEPLREEIVASRAARYRALQERVLDLAPKHGLTLLARYENLPLLHLRVSELDALIALLQQPEVGGVFEDVRYEHQLARSLPLIQQPAVASSSLLGQDTAVAVLDTGCDYRLPDFGSCSNAGAAGCKVAFAADIANNDGALDDNGHGTNVSAIVLGVAPATKIIALDVFDGSTAPWSAILSAMDWVISNRTKYNIVGINMSLGGGQYSAPCSGDAMSNAIANARSVGVLSAIASGNNGWSQYMSAPGCASSALSVGAVYSANFGGLQYSSCTDSSTSADKITCFSNSTSFLSLLAPGALISAGGHQMAGTSQATPHVAGAIAVLRAAFPDESLAQTVARLTESGPTITDARNSVTKHRLDLLAAVNGDGIADRTAPSGSIQINNGDAFARSLDVTLTLTGSDNQSSVEICVSDSPDCTSFEPFVGSMGWTLPAGDGLKTVYLSLQDASKNKTVVSDSITLDTTAPAGANLSVVPADGAVYLNWTQASDAGSGFAAYKLVVADGDPPSCDAGTTLYSGGATSFVHTQLHNGATYGYRLCLLDVAGNLGPGPSALGKPTAEAGTPFGAVIISGDAAFTSSQDVMLTLTATDTSDAAEICVSNGDSCTAWIAYVPIIPWHLDAASGTATVRVWFRDGQGMASATSVSDSIQVDLGKPSTSTLSAKSGDGRAELTWSAATDAVSGVAGYRIVVALTSAPSCEDGVQIYKGTDRSFTHSGLQNGVLYGYRVCAYDAAGNESEGSAAIVRPAPEYDAPVGSVSINDGAAFTNQPDVTLTLVASDVSGIAQMCVSNTSSCSSWTSYVTRLPWTLDKKSANPTVYVWFQDSFGNASAAPVSDSIGIDSTAPSGGQLNAAAQDGAVSLSWSGVTDAASGVAGYKLLGKAGDPPSCSNGTELYQGAGSSFTHSGLKNGTVYGYRLCPIDAAGNMGSGLTASARPAPELDAPVGTVVINQDALYANSAEATLGLSATDASGVAQMCISNTTTCSSWLAYSSSASWTLDTRAASATVYAWFRDIYGNTNAVPVSDDILLDMAAPSAGELRATSADSQVSLSWSGVTDAISGVAGYKLVVASGDPPSCAQGSEIYSGMGNSFVHRGLVNGTQYGYRLCATDVAGNINGGAVVSARPAPEFDGPAGNVVINGNAPFTADPKVSLSLSANDASPITDMCISNGASCTAWRAFEPSIGWDLGVSNKLATVSVWFRDSYGNVSSAAASDTIVVDTTPPTSGMLTGVPGDAKVTLTWTDATDALSGVTGYQLVTALDAIPDCSTGTTIYAGTRTTFTHSGLENGRSYGYRICPIDAAGNVGSGASVVQRPAPEFDEPGGAVVINDDAPYTNDVAVTLSLSALDQSGVVQMCISNSPTCTAWTELQTKVSWTLGVRDALAHVYVWFKDTYGNINPVAFSDSIFVDTTAPESGALSATSGDSAVSLSWGEATDAASGVAGYRLFAATDSTPDCSGTPIYSGGARAFTHSGLQNGTLYHYRLCPVDGVGNVAAGSTASARPAPEHEGPTCTLSINGGAPYTNDPAATLTLAAQDASGVAALCVSNTADCSSWQAPSSTLSWALATRSGVATVSAWFKDNWGNVSQAACSDTIVVDTAAPSSGSLSATAGNGLVQLSWTEGSDSGSGVAGYKLVAAIGMAPSCSDTAIYSGNGSAFTHTGLVNGKLYTYRLCPIDGAGNIAQGATASAEPAPEFDGPVGSVVINAGEDFTQSSQVSLGLSASDPNGVAQMCISNSASCSSWVGFATTAAWKLQASSGPASVHVWFKDSYGNVSAVPCSDSISVDSTAPSAGTLTASAGDARVQLSWTDGTDTGSGIASYRLMAQPGEAPSCSSGTQIYSGSALSYTHTGLSNGQVYGYRLCPVDRVGNMGDGVTATTLPKPESDGPVGSVRINDGAEYTNNTLVTLTLSASDPSGVAQMCINNSASACSSWVALTSSADWQLGTSSGAASVYVWFKDNYGNVSSAPVSDSIVVDGVGPKAGALTASPADSSVSLSWSATDALSGVAQYRLMAAVAEAPSCSEGSPVYAGSATQFTHTGLHNGLQYGYRICPIDAAGNLGSDATASARPAPEFVGPVGQVSINAGATYTNSAEVALALSADDPSGVAQMCISNGASCSSWSGFTANALWTLDSRNGSATVRVWFQDSYGNVSATPASASIVLDTMPPSGAVLTATPGDAQIELSWTAASDALSGVAAYQLRYAPGVAPDCTSGEELYRGSATSFTHSGLQNGTLYAYRVCALDVAGNVGAGPSASARPAPEFDPPVGRVYIEGGTRIVSSRDVHLSLSATDQSQVTGMCLSNTTSCSDWLDYATSATWTLGPSSGAATVRAWFRDEYGNAMTVPTLATIIVDMEGPSMGSLNALATVGKVYLSWGRSSDLAGVAYYTLVRQPGSEPPASCTHGEEVYHGTDRATSHDLSSGTYAYRLCAVDAVGNMSTGVTRSVTVP